MLNNINIFHPVLDLAKLKKVDSGYLKKRASPKLVKHYDYNVIIVGER
jgi:hypothetical protein